MRQNAIPFLVCAANHPEAVSAEGPESLTHVARSVCMRQMKGCREDVSRLHGEAEATHIEVRPLPMRGEVLMMVQMIQEGTSQLLN